MQTDGPAGIVHVGASLAVHGAAITGRGAGTIMPYRCGVAAEMALHTRPSRPAARRRVTPKVTGIHIALRVFRDLEAGAPAALHLAVRSRSSLRYRRGHVETAWTRHACPSAYGFALYTMRDPPRQRMGGTTCHAWLPPPPVGTRPTHDTRPVRVPAMMIRSGRGPLASSPSSAALPEDGRNESRLTAPVRRIS